MNVHIYVYGYTDGYTNIFVGIHIYKHICIYMYEYHVIIYLLKLCGHDLQTQTQC